MASKHREVISHWHSLADDFSTSALDFYTAVEEALKVREVPDISTERVTFKEGGVLTAEREYLRVRRQAVIFDICAAPYGNSYFFSWWLAKEPKSTLGWVILMIGIALITLFAFLQAFFTSFENNLRVMMVGGPEPPGAWGAVILIVLLIPVAFGLLRVAAVNGVVDEDQLLEVPVLGYLYDKIFAPLTYYRLDTAIMFQESVSRAVNEVIQGIRSQQGLRALTPEELKPTSNLFGR